MIRLALTIACLLACGFADACSRREGAPTLEESYASAKEVFVAHVVDAHERDAPRAWGESEAQTVVEAKYSIKESLKGDAPRVGEVYDLPDGIGNCSIPLVAGHDYVFFVQPHDGTPDVRFVGMMSGSFALDTDAAAAANLDRVRKLAHKESNLGNPR